jgi:spherulation-specific family 4 protein
MTCTKFCLLSLIAFVPCLFLGCGVAKPSGAQRRQKAKEFHLRAQERTGLLVPMYVYPADIHKNHAYNRLIDLKRRYETVPVWVIVNPASGPGEQVDDNYTKTIDRLLGAGCVVLGYVPTSYAKRPTAEVQGDINRWLTMYPRSQGIFFDEMIYEDSDAGVRYQAALNQYAHDAGCWPTVANPGADTPGRYFAAGAADVIVIHEGGSWPKEERLKGDYFGGYADYPPFTRAILIHSQPNINRDALGMMRKYARWIYVTEAEFRQDDPKASNPWDRLSKHVDLIFSQLADK